MSELNNTGLNEELTEETKTDAENSDEVVEDGENTQQEEKKEDIKNEENQLFGAPENYDYQAIELPEGIKFDNALAEKFSPIAKELNLSQEGANKLVNMLIEHQQEQLADSANQIAEYERQKQEMAILEYSKQVKADKEIGVNEQEQNAYMDIADKGYKAFATKGLQETIEKSGLNYHPEVIKLFHRLGKLCGEDKVLKASNPVAEEKSPAQILYGNREEQ